MEHRHLIEVSGNGAEGATRAQVKRVLFVSYVFPPVGGAGVQRISKFVKYLPQWGWSPSVLVPSNPSVPVFDRSLVSDLPAGTIVRRARTLEPSYKFKTGASAENVREGSRVAVMFDTFRRVIRRAAAALLQPDPAVLWAPAAVLEGRRLLLELPHSAIVATGPPFSCFLIGRALQRISGLPLVLDYRDEWDLSHRFLENRGSGVLATRLQHVMQRRVMRAANVVIATTTRSVAALEQVRNEVGSRAPVLCIRNGFDPDDFVDVAGASVREDRSRYRVVYAGTLWNLTSVEPLVRAIKLLADREPGLAERLEVVFAGRCTRDQEALLRTLTGTPIRLVEYPYMDHDSVLELVRSADLLCALLTDAADAERVLPAKIFEYMASGRPVLAIAPRGELWEILDAYPHAHLFLPSDIAGIATFLQGQAASYRGELPERPLPWDGSPYDRRRQAGQLAEVLDALADFEPMSERHPLVSCT